MQWSDELIGRHSAPRVHHIDRCALQQFSCAVGLTYPPYCDTESARQAGYPDVIAPPTFPFTLAANAIPGIDMPAAGIIHGEQDFEYGAPIVAGDHISVVSSIHALKRRAKIVFLTIRTVGTNQRDEQAFVSQSLLLINASTQEVE